MLERRQHLTAITSSGFNYLTAPQNIEFTFDTDVSADLSLDDLVVDRLSNNTTLARANQSLAYNTGNNKATVTFPGESNGGITGMLPDGNFQAAVSEEGIPGMTAEYLYNYFFLTADANHDRAVSLNDHTALQANLGTTGKDFSEGDFDLDGDVDLSDWTILQANYSRQLPSPITTSNTLSVAALTSSSNRLTWTRPDAAVDGYRVFRSTDGTNFTQIADVDASIRTFDDTGLADGTKFWYRVRPFTFAEGNSTTTNKKSAVTVMPAPTLVEATAISDSAIAISWANNATHPLGFNVFRSATGLPSSWSIAGWAGATEESFLDIGLIPNTTYHYYVQTVGSDEDSAPSFPASALTHEGSLAVPVNVETTTIGQSSATVVWEYDDPRVDGFRIVSVAADGTETVIADNISASARQLQLTGLHDGYPYQLFVQAFDIDPSQTADSALTTFTTVLPSPLALTAATPIHESQITLTWSNAAVFEPAEVGFEIYISEGTSGSGYLATVDPGDGETYTATGLTSGTGYGFQVAAFRRDASSEPAAMSVATKLSAPSGFSASAANAREVNLNWDDESTTEERFAIQYWKQDDPHNTKVTFAPENATGISIIGLEPDTNYVFQIRAGFEWNGGMVTSAVSEAFARTTETDECPPDTSPPAGQTASAIVHTVSCPGPTPPPPGSEWMNAFTHCGGGTGGGGTGGNPFDPMPQPWPPDTCPECPPVNPDPDPDPPCEDPSPLPVVSISASDGSGSESPDAGGSAPGTISFTISRQGSPTNALGVDLHPFAGAALIGVDYTADGATATIPAGEHFMTFSLIPIDDNLFEFEEKVYALLKASSEYWLSATFKAEGVITDNDIDLAIDSNNDGRFTPADDALEDGSSNAGKLVVVNRDDDDQDSILDFADGFNLFEGTNEDEWTGGELFTPVQLQIASGVAPGSTITFDYDLAAPGEVTRTVTEVDALDGETYEKYEYGVGEGLLRLWTKPGHMARTESDLLTPGTEYAPSSLGLFGDATLWLEAVNGSSTGVTITATLDRPDGTSEDTVNVFTLDPLVGIDPSVQIEGFNIIRGGGSLSLEGTETRDIIIGGNNHEIINGLAGNDIIIAGPNEYTAIDAVDSPAAFAGDRTNGGRGADLIFAWSGNNTVVRGNGDEVSRVEGTPVDPITGPENEDQRHAPFTSEDIIAAYKWMYGNDIWLKGFFDLNGRVLAVERDGRNFSDWHIHWDQDGLGETYRGYDVIIEHDIGGGSVIAAAATLRQAIMVTTFRDFRWVQWMQGQQANNLSDLNVYGELIDSWRNMRQANFDRAKEVAAIAAELQISIITIPLGAVGEVADMVISFPQAVNGDVGSMLAMLPLVPGAVRHLPTRARVLIDFGFDSFRMIGAKADVVLRENATLGFVLRYDLVRATGEWILPKVKRVDIGDGRQTWIVGDAQKIYDDLGNFTQHSAPHANKITDFSDELAATGRFSHITLNRSVRTATGRCATAANQAGIDTVSNIRPDIVAVRWDGKVEMYEVRSPSQDAEDLRRAMRSAMRTLPPQYQTLVTPVLEVPQ